MSQEQDDLLEQFKTVSGASDDQARFFMESSGWDVGTALASYYETNPGEENISEMSATSSDSVSAGAGAAEASSKPGRIVTMDGSDDSDSDDEQGQAFYAGGSQHSGQQVLGPNKPKNLVNKFFKAVKEQGARVVSPDDEAEEESTTFQGTSYKLGDTNTPSQVIRDSSGRTSQMVAVNLHAYPNGFTIDDGPLREYSEPQNLQFLENVQRGQMPKELVSQHPGREISLQMHRHNSPYVPKKTAAKAFTGTGQALGGIAPALATQSSTPAAADPKQAEEQAKKNLNVDSSQPTTNVQIRLRDGSRLVVRANHTHTVADLRAYLSTARPEHLGQNYTLMTTFPHAELSALESTLKDANLLNAAIVVKNK